MTGSCWSRPGFVMHFVLAGTAGLAVFACLPFEAPYGLAMKRRTHVPQPRFQTHTVPS